MYWFLFTDEGKRFWRTKLKNLNMQPLDEEEKEIHPKGLKDFTRIIQNSSILLKLALGSWGVFFITFIMMILYAILT